MEIIILGKIKCHWGLWVSEFDKVAGVTCDSTVQLPISKLFSVFWHWAIELSSQLDCNSRLQRFAVCVVGTGAIDPLPLQHHLHPPYYRWSPQTSLLIYCKMFGTWHGERNQAVPVVNYVRLCFVISTIDMETSRLSFITLQCLVFSHTKA